MNSNDKNSCEDNSLTSRYDNLFLKSSGPFYEVRENETTATANTAGALIDQLISEQKLDTGSGVASSVANGFDLLQNTASSIVDGAIDSDSIAANFGGTSEAFKEIKSFAQKLDLTDPFDRFGRQNIIELTDALNDYFFSSGEINLSNYPSLEERTNTDAPRLSYAEVADFLSDSEISTDNLIDELNSGNTDPTNSATLLNLSESLDRYFNDNIGTTLSQGLCGTIAEIYETVITILELIPIFVSHINMIRSLFATITDLDFIKLAIQVAQQLIYKAIKDKILEVINLIYETVKKKILAVVNSAKALIAGLQGKRSTPYTSLEEAYNDVDDFFSDLSLESFKKKIEGFIDDLGKQFERFTVENIGQLIYRLCKFIDGLQALLFGPADEFQRVVINTSTEMQMMQSVSLMNAKRAVEYGGLRMSKSLRKGLQDQVREAVNAVSAPFDDLIAGESTDYITAPDMTAEEAETLFALSGPVLPHFVFSGTANEPYKNGSSIKNFRRTKPIVFARLMRMSKRTGYTYNVKEAFLERSDGKERGASENTIPSSGASIKIAIEGDFNWTAKTIISASQEGFVGIGVGNDYIHLDIGPRELTWVDGYTAGFTSAKKVSNKSDATKYIELLERHRRREFTKKVL